MFLFAVHLLLVATTLYKQKPFMEGRRKTHHWLRGRRPGLVANLVCSLKYIRTSGFDRCSSDIQLKNTGYVYFSAVCGKYSHQSPKCMSHVSRHKTGIKITCIPTVCRTYSLEFRLCICQTYGRDTGYLYAISISSINIVCMSDIQVFKIHFTCIFSLYVIYTPIKLLPPSILTIG